MRNDFYTGYAINNSSAYLAHYGVLGMKWGIRRYQNYDGTYTQKGLKRFREDQAKYERAKEDHKKLKAAYKQHKKTGQDIYVNGNARITDPKAAVKLSNQFVKKSKKEMEYSYKRLKEHKMADEGKRLYNSGHTITGDATVSSTLSAIGGMSLFAAGKIAQQRGYFTNASKFLAGAGAAAILGATVKEAVDYSRARKLRAYYSHHQ